MVEQARALAFVRGSRELLTFVNEPGKAKVAYHRHALAFHWDKVHDEPNPSGHSA